MFLVAVIYMHAIAQAVPLTWRATIRADFGVVVTANGQTMGARKKVLMTTQGYQSSSYLFF